ncbi:MAG: Tad domain-containing protein [Oligoflexia bacterium]|nr:Tad domain-containing protein [Oligoflexia bacterium]
MKFLKNARGQVAIFVVLIFQVLFILFAMTLNIAMVTYDKINLQNSLDLAVYYGAKKQAEVLNAMAHINYQMRQNWKLLAWRYRIMGTLVQYEGGTEPKYWCPQKFNSIKSCESRSSNCQSAQSILDDVYGNDYCDFRYFVCISHDLWKRGIQKSKQNLCNKVGFNIPPVVDLIVVAPFMGEALLAFGGINDLQDNLEESCPAEGAVNWLMTQFFMTHFRLDQLDRKLMIEEIYNRSLKEGKDLDGAEIFGGAKKVFRGNLTKANLESVKSLADYGLQDFNSFKDKDFKEIFKKLNVWPVLQFARVEVISSNGSTDCNVHMDQHYKYGDFKYNDDAFEKVQKILRLEVHPLAGALRDEVKLLFRFNALNFFRQDDPDPMRELTLSFFKDKDQTLYYGLKAEFDYLSQNQIFSLSSPVKFKASAFAKAFGGNFGPQPEQSDPLIPVHSVSGYPSPPSLIPNSNQLNVALLQPNHSRFPGDRWGLIDKRLHDNRHPSEMNFLNKHAYYNKIQRVYSMEDYFHLIWGTGKRDPLVQRPSYNPYNFTRMMELMAVYPDLYDISYYSILGNYHQTYFKKICKLLLGGSDCDLGGSNKFNSPAALGRPVYIRGDFGWKDSQEYLEENYRKKVIELSIAPYFLNQDNGKVATNIIKDPGYDSSGHPPRLWGKIQYESNRPKHYRDNGFYPLSQGNLFYPWLARSDPDLDKAKLPDGLLSSWTNPHPLNYEKYELDEDRFLKCESTALKTMPVPSACASGGRSGYSVKLISCETVRDFDLQPSNIDDYCPN